MYLRARKIRIPSPQRFDNALILLSNQATTLRSLALFRQREIEEALSVVDVCKDPCYCQSQLV